jgi:uncharacterized membrane protein HdeD (DUF308 family)
MLNVYTHNWWSLVLRGLLAVIFGVVAFIMPDVTWTALVFVWGAYAIVDGIFSMVAGFRAPKGHKRWWLMLISGVLGIAAGAVAFLLPVLTGLFLILLMGGWAVATGIVEIVAAIQMRKQIAGEWFLVLSGIASVAFGILLFIDPYAGAVAVVWIIGIYAVMFGILMMILGFKLRGLEHSTHHPTPHPA